MRFHYYLPGENNEKTDHSTETNSIVIIGANGSGKTKLGEWIEKSAINKVHRIGAQRSLTFGKYIQQKSFEQAKNLVLYGNENTQQHHDYRWGYDGEKCNYTSSLLNDYEHVLSALIALKNEQQEDYLKECKEKERGGQPHAPVPAMAVDTLKEIWASVFPHRDISLDDAKVTAIYSRDDASSEYRGTDMSDGEHVALYLIAQALCVLKDTTIIIDESEIHLHRSIMGGY